MASGKLQQEEAGGVDQLVSTPLTSKAAAALLMATRSKQAKRDHQQHQQQVTFQLERLPVIVLDRIFGLLEAEDLRRFHQVSKGWKRSVLERPKVDLRRVKLVEWIRLNKENAPKGTGTRVPFATPSTKETPPTWRNHHQNNGDDGKPGGRGILSSTESLRNVSTEKLKSSSKSRRGADLTTPTSRFFRFYEAGKKLPKGQQLFRCPECQSPVPSPMSTAVTSMSLKSSSRSRWLSAESSSTPKPKQMPTSSSSIKASNSSSSISPNNTQDSGFESIEASSQSYSSGSLIDLSSSCQILDSTSLLDSTDYYLTSDSHPTPSRPEITLSFIATPDDTTTATSHDKFHLSQDSGTGEDPSQLEEEDKDDEVFDEDSSLKTPNSVKCPACSFRFCSKCQCTDHPGRSCRLIGCGGGNVGSSKDLRSGKKRTKDELRRAARL